MSDDKDLTSAGRVTQRPLQRQAELPNSIKLLRYIPPRPPFLLDGWHPSKVATVNDLPPYLILGRLDENSLLISAEGWSALWKGDEEGTHVEIKYLRDKARYETRQVWCGIDGGLSTCPSEIPLDRAITQSLIHFPANWDLAAKETLEREFQISFFEQSDQNFYAYFPDGIFKTIAFPVAVKNLRLVRERLREFVRNSKPNYPISAYARILTQAINYPEGKAPDWTTRGTVVFNHSLEETGTVPHGMPIRETAKNGTSAWTLRRDAYVVFVDLPFAGLINFLKSMSSSNGPIRVREDVALEVGAIVMPANLEGSAKSIAFWNKERTARCFWQLAKPGEDPTLQMAKAFEQDDAVTDDLLRTAEAISVEVTEAVQKS